MVIRYLNVLNASIFFLLFFLSSFWSSGTFLCFVLCIDLFWTKINHPFFIYSYLIWFNLILHLFFLCLIFDVYVSVLLIFYFTFTLCRTLFVGRFLDDEACNQLIASLIWLQGQNSKDPITLYFNVSSYCNYFYILLFIFIFIVVVIVMYIHIYIYFTILSFLRLSLFPSYSLSLSLYLPPSPLSLSPQSLTYFHFISFINISLVFRFRELWWSQH